MQTLDYFNEKGEPQTKDFPVPSGYTGVSVGVQDGKETVTLTVDGHAVSLSPGGARELALALRQSANRMERINRMRS